MNTGLCFEFAALRTTGDIEKFVRRYGKVPVDRSEDSEFWIRKVALFRELDGIWRDIEGSVPEAKATLRRYAINRIEEEIKSEPNRYRWSMAVCRVGPSHIMLLTDSILGEMLGAMFRAIVEDGSFRACWVCGKGFEIKPPAGRKHRKLCSDACKAKAYRQRKAKAQRLAQEST